MASSPAIVLGLDVGEKRIGVARGIVAVGLASPLTTIENTADAPEVIAELCRREQAEALIVGHPRNLQGEPTAQTAFTEQFAAQLRVAVPIIWQDESLTSVKAEQELARRGQPYQKGEVDALAATYIVEDYLEAHHG